jgi:transcriptional regulator NrdR family protein
MPFSHARLLLELLQVCDHRDDLEDSVPYLASTVEQKLYKLLAKAQEPAITRSELLTATSETLRHYDSVAYVKYIGMHQRNLDAATLRRALKRGK